MANLALRDYAIFATDAYSADDGPAHSNWILPSGYSIVSPGNFEFSHPASQNLSTGFNARVYRNGATAVVSFTGSMGLLDFLADAQELAGAVNQQVPDAIAFFDSVKIWAAQNSITEIVLTGHSLGGALASVIAAREANGAGSLVSGAVVIAPLPSTAMVTAAVNGFVVENGPESFTIPGAGSLSNVERITHVTSKDDFVEMLDQALPSNIVGTANGLLQDVQAARIDGSTAHTSPSLAWGVHNSDLYALLLDQPRVHQLATQIRWLIPALTDKAVTSIAMNNPDSTAEATYLSKLFNTQINGFGAVTKLAADLDHLMDDDTLREGAGAHAKHLANALTRFAVEYSARQTFAFPVESSNDRFSLFEERGNSIRVEVNKFLEFRPTVSTIQAVMDVNKIAQEAIGLNNVPVLHGPYTSIDEIKYNNIFVQIGSSGLNLVGADAATNLADVIFGGLTSDTVSGKGGNDLIFGGTWAGTENAQTDYDRGEDKLDGGDGDDIIFGGRDNDTLVGGNGNDVLHGGDKRSEAVGTADGVDVADYSADVSGITATLKSVNFMVKDGWGFDDLLFSIEKIVGSTHNDKFRVQGNTIAPDPNFPGRGSVTVDGNGGKDTIDFSAVSFGVKNRGVSGGYLEYRMPDGTTVKTKGVERIDGSSQRDTLAGSTGTETIMGGGGDDFIYGSAPGMIIYGGTGNDLFNLGHNILIADAEEGDDVSLYGTVLMTGALRNIHSESPYAIGMYGERYGINVAGDLIIHDIFERDTFINNYVGGPGALFQMAGIYVAEFLVKAFRLLDPDLPPGSVNSQIKLLYAYFKSMGVIDPLVLDLDGDGIELTAETVVAPRFDVDGDLFGERTGWVRPDDGLLALDANANGTIDNVRELFGGANQSGFAELATHDLNADGKIDSNDAVFSSLRVWRDLNQNGVTDDGELSTLTEAGISAINLASVSTNITNAGNSITATGTFTWTAGGTGTVADVQFQADQFQTEYLGDKTISSAAEGLPEVKGHGTLADLRVAATLDPTLVATIQNNIGAMNVPDLAALRDLATPILTGWSLAVKLPDANGVLQTIDPGAHADVPIFVEVDNTGASHVTDFAFQVTDGLGSYWKLASERAVRDENNDEIDRPTLQDIYDQVSEDGSWQTFQGEHIGFLERYTGQALPIGNLPTDLENALDVIGPVIDTFWTTLNLVTVRLAMQGPLAPYFDGVEYNPETDKFVPTTAAQLTPMYEAIFDAAPATAQGAAEWLAQWQPFLEYIIGDLDRAGDLLPTYGYLFANMVDAYETVGLPLSIQDTAGALGIPSDLIVTGTGTVNGSSDTNLFYMGPGNQTAHGGVGPDSYVFGNNFGQDVIDDYEWAGGLRHEDIARFAAHASTDVTAYRDGLDLIIKVNNSTDEVRIIDQFLGPIPALGGGGDLQNDTGVKEITFADGVVWDRIDIAKAVSHAAPTSDTIIGTDDIDVLDGGAGDDYLAGGDELDIYRFGLGYGHDTITDEPDHILAANYDLVEFGDGVTKDDIVFSRTGDSNNVDLQIVGTTDILTILGQFEAAYTGVFGKWWSDRIESVVFKDGSYFSWDEIMDVVIDTYSTDGNDSIYGFAREDMLDGGLGDDYLAGGAETDTYVFNVGYGHDTIYDDETTILVEAIDRVSLGADITTSNITLQRTGAGLNDLLIGVEGTTDTLLIQGQFVADNLGNRWMEVEEYHFADGTIWDRGDVQDWLLDAAKTTGDDIIDGFFSDDTLDGGAGNDTLYGRDGGDTYVFGLGHDDDVVEDRQNSIFADQPDRVVFQAGITTENIHLSRTATSSTADLTFTFDGTSDSLTISGQFSTSTLGTRMWEVEEFHFADGTVWDRWDVQAMLLQSTAGNDHLIGFFSNDTLDGGTGNDTLEGGDAADTYVFGLGYGVDVVYDYQWSIFNDHPDTVRFGAGILPEDLVFSVQGDDLVVSIDGTQDAVVIRDQLAFAFNQIEQFEFANGTLWDLAELRSHYIVPNNGPNLVTGTALSDFLDGAGGADTMIGLAGNDAYMVSETGDQVIEAENEGIDTVYAYATFTLPDHVENLTLRGTSFVSGYGNASDNVITANDLAVLLEGRGGNDTLIGSRWSGDILDGGTGADQMIGGDGGDTYYVDNASDTIVETNTGGSDLVRSSISYSLLGTNVERLTLLGSANIDATGSDAANLLTGNTGNNSMAGGGGVDTLNAGDGQDVLDGGAGNDTLSGEAGDDTLDGGTGADTMTGGAGADTYYVDNASDWVVDSTAGSLDLVISSVSFATDLFSGTSIDRITLTGDQSINATGNALANVLTGNAADNVLNGGAGADTLVGGAGNDLYVIDNAGDVIVEQQGLDTDSVNSSVSYVLSDYVENLTLTGSGHINGAGNAENNRILGNSGRNSLFGDVGVDTLTGGAGDDTLEGGAGADTLEAGDGVDTLSYASSSAGVTIDLATGIVSRGDAEGDSVSGFESAHGSAFGDTLVGSAAANILTGGAGSDQYRIGLDEGWDTIFDSAGLDTLQLGPDVEQSALTFTRFNNDVTVRFEGADGVVVKNMFAADDAAIDRILLSDGTLISAAAIKAGFLQSTDEGDSIAGFGSSDVIDGGLGDDYLVGGGGADTLVGGDGVDTASYAWSTVGIHIDLAAGIVSGGDAEGDVFVGIEAIGGSEAADTIIGNAGDNLLGGASGDDTISGGAGRDTLYGGAGFDTFIVETGWGVDTIDETVSVWSESGAVAAEMGRIVFGAGITLDDLTLSRGGSGLSDLIIRFDGTDDVLNVTDQFNLYNSVQWEAPTSYYRTGVETIEFADGTTLSRAQIAAMNLTLENDGDNFVRGTEFNEEFLLGAGDDEVTAGDGDDTLNGGTGTDLLYGDAGFDSYVVETSWGHDRIIESATQHDEYGQGAGLEVPDMGRIVFGSEIASTDVTLSRGGDNLTDLIIRLNGSADVLTVADQFNAYNTLLPEDPDWHYRYGVDSIVFGDGTVWTREQVAAMNLAVENQGDNYVYGTARVETFLLGDGNDEVEAGGGDDTVNGGSGTDWLYGGAGYDSYLFGVGSGIDRIYEYTDIYADPAETTTGRLMLDSGILPAGVTLTRSGYYLTDLYVQINGTSDVAIIDNYFASHNLVDPSDPEWFARSGIDTIEFANGTVWDRAYLASLTIAVDYSGDNELFGTSGNDSLDAGAGNDLLWGAEGNDTLVGGTGNDTLWGGEGGDTLTGGSGTDTAGYDYAQAAVSINLGTGGTSGGEAAGDVLSGIENIAGSAYGDTLVGDGAANMLVGNAGNDTLDGGSGDDTLEGGDGADTIIGSSGTADIVSYTQSYEAITVDLATSSVAGGDAAGDVISGIEGVFGSNYDDTLTGSTGNNVFRTGWGADTVIGGGGDDTVSYAASEEAVQVNLATNVNHGGHAEGDVLQAIKTVQGSAFNDTIVGGTGGDVLHGLGGADTIDGGAGSDVAAYNASAVGVTVNLATNVNSGGDAAGDILLNIERIIGSGFNDTLTGNSGDNHLQSIGGNDTIDGGAGNDTLGGGVGADTIIGSAGMDTADYRGAAAGVTVNLATGLGSAGEANGDVLIDVEAIYGSAHADTLTGHSGDNTLHGAAGADVLDGGAGTDTAAYAESNAGVVVNLVTGIGSGGHAQGDTLAGIENVIGSAFADTLTGGTEDNTFLGAAGGDTIDGGAGNDTATYTTSTSGVKINLAAGTASGGDAQGDVLTGIENVIGSASVDTLVGTTGNNLLVGGAGGDTIDGGSGTDTVSYAGSSAVTINLATGAASGGEAQGDTLAGIENVIGGAAGDFLTGDSGVNVLWGGGHNDSLVGGGGDDTLFGDSGNDYLVGGSGADTIDGGDGEDTVEYTTSGSAISVNLATGVATGGDAAGDAFLNIEAISGSAYNDTLIGNSANNTFIGNGGNDYLDGAGGDDVFMPGTGADTIVGGDGADTIDHRYSNASVTLNLLSGVSSGGHANFDVFSGVENLTGSEFADVLTGDGGANVLSGRAGDDTISGGSGDDTILGDAGADSLNGGSGNDTLDHRASGSAVSVNLATGASTGGTAQGDVIAGFESVIGSAFDDTLVGDTADNTLTGSAGNDSLTGGAGMDTLFGGDGFDVISYEASSSGVSVSLAGGANTGGDAEGDVIFGVEGLLGSALDDMLMGDTLDNLLVGGLGNDTITGGLGADDFAFGANNGDDRITDFQVGIDRVSLDQGLNGSGIETAVDALANVTNDGQGNAVLDLGAGNSVVLVGVTLTQLSINDFVIHP